MRRRGAWGNPRRAARLAGGLMPASAWGLHPQCRDLLGLAEPLVQSGYTSSLLRRRGHRSAGPTPWI